jgi:tRNA threonylcarbamoyladenosine biosynthesis protein TsaB
VIVLGIDTATRIATVGLADDGRAGANRALPMVGSHARTLLPLISDLLSAAALTLRDLDLVAVSIGPGSFTGLRIGLSTAKGLCLASSLPVIGVSTLEAYARAAGSRPDTVWPVLDARKGEVYAAGFRWRDSALDTVRPARALSPEALLDDLSPPCLLVGDGVDAYAEFWQRHLGAGAELIRLDALPPNGSVVAALGGELFARRGGDDLAAVEPTYCRPSEAEVHFGRRSALSLAERGKIDRGEVVG